MPTRTFHLNEAQVSELYAAYLHCQDAATRTRYQAVRLYGSGYPVAQIVPAAPAAWTGVASTATVV